MSEVNKIREYIEDNPKLITGLIVVGGVIFISVSAINIISYTMCKINDIIQALHIC